MRRNRTKADRVEWMNPMQAGTGQNGISGNSTSSAAAEHYGGNRNRSYHKSFEHRSLPFSAWEALRSEISSTNILVPNRA